MHYEFRKNGNVSLSLRPDADAVEQAFFKALFAGEVEVVHNDTHHRDEILIRRKVTVPKKDYETMATA